MTGPDEPAAPVTLRTIAELAGVHPSTVSRALRRADATDATAVRIREIAERLDYRGNSAAASLRTRRSQTIGVIVPHLTDTVQAIHYEAIERAALAVDFQTVVATTHDELEQQRARVKLLLSRGVDGLIIGDAHTDGRYADWIATLRVPYVLNSRGLPGHPSVTGDDYLGGQLAATHLADLGHERVAVLSGPDFSPAIVERVRGFRDTWRDRGLPGGGEMLEPCPIFGPGVERSTERLLERRGDLTALFAINDDAAVWAMRVLRRHGREPGRDVAVVGYNDVALATPLGLTSVRSPHAAMGEWAVRMLLDAIRDRPLQPVRLAPELIVRATSCRP